MGATMTARERLWAAAKPGRLMSLDALRGFDMFWIVGADALVEALRKLNDGRVVWGAVRTIGACQLGGIPF